MSSDLEMDGSRRLGCVVVVPMEQRLAGLAGLVGRPVVVVPLAALAVHGGEVRE